MPMRRKKQLVPLLLLAFFIVWQTDTVFHLVLVPHMVCKHGKIVDADPEPGHPLHDPHEEDNPNHEDCRILTLLTSAETRTRDYPQLSAVLGTFENKTYVSIIDIEVLRGEDLFRISPSNSPPHAS